MTPSQLASPVPSWRAVRGGAARGGEIATVRQREGARASPAVPEARVATPSVFSRRQSSVRRYNSRSRRREGPGRVWTPSPTCPSPRATARETASPSVGAAFDRLSPSSGTCLSIGEFGINRWLSGRVFIISI
ncbi:uncharacterized protein LOC143199455 [Rhynchophorus ferrugineus]|uniref:uncharacterized protein LOC143199455 n=1 Tax=Rhynchophorus ferrugineus TaxID=354439 RepID=UPI003FCCDC11